MRIHLSDEANENLEIIAKRENASKEEIITAYLGMIAEYMNGIPSSNDTSSPVNNNEPVKPPENEEPKKPKRKRGRRGGKKRHRNKTTN